MMYNLYRSPLLKRLFRGLLLCIMGYNLLSIGIAHENVFLNQANQNITAQNNYLLTSPARALWQEAFSRGFVLRQHQSDISARTAFVDIQAEVERQIITAMSQKGTKALWIIHTPLIATPVVTEGALSKELVSPDILADKNEGRLKTSLDRAKLIRLFLNKGGIVVVAYAEEDKYKRTPLQLAIFEKLKKQYPQQLIDFAIASKHFPNGKYPLDKIGATYFFYEPQGMFEMTNRGLQINDVQNDATWGIWLQERQHPNIIVKNRLSEVLSFLEHAGLREKIKSQEGLFFLS